VNRRVSGKLAAEAANNREQEPRVTWWPAVGVHVGLLIVCASCVYTLEPLLFGFSRRQWLGFAALGLVLVGAVAFTGGRAAASRAGRLLLGLGAGLVLWLAYKPLLEDLPGLSGVVPAGLAQLEPGIGLVGLGIALIFWLVYRGVAREGIRPGAPFRRAVLASAALVLVLAAVMYLSLRGLYDLGGGLESLILTYYVVQYAVLLLICVEMSGAAGVGGLAHLYVGAALVIAVGRNLMA
jgi:hypothetical protein